MKDVERVFRAVLQAASVIVLGAEAGEVERDRLRGVHAAGIDLMLGSGLKLVSGAGGIGWGWG